MIEIIWFMFIWAQISHKTKQSEIYQIEKIEYKKLIDKKIQNLSWRNCKDSKRYVNIGIEKKLQIKKFTSQSKISLDALTKLSSWTLCCLAYEVMLYIWELECDARI